MCAEQKPSYMGHRQRIREKFAAGGLEHFLDHEILELLLTYCIARRDTKPLAWALIKRFGSVAAVLDAEPKELSSVPGIGEQSAIFKINPRRIQKIFVGRSQRENSYSHAG